jgi:hypothetical protein
VQNTLFLDNFSEVYAYIEVKIRDEESQIEQMNQKVKQMPTKDRYFIT